MAVNVWKKSTSKMRNHAEKRKKKNWRRKVGNKWFTWHYRRLEKLIAYHQLLYIVSIIIYCKYRFG